MMKSYALDPSKKSELKFKKRNGHYTTNSRHTNYTLIGQCLFKETKSTAHCACITKKNTLHRQEREH